MSFNPKVLGRYACYLRQYPYMLRIVRLDAVLNPVVGGSKSHVALRRDFLYEIPFRERRLRKALVIAPQGHWLTFSVQSVCFIATFHYLCIFQFHMVRLRQTNYPGESTTSGISIPHGTIKTRLTSQKRLYRKRISIPHGTIKTVRRSVAVADGEFISIPHGTIKTLRTSVLMNFDKYFNSTWYD